MTKLAPIAASRPSQEGARVPKAITIRNFRLFFSGTVLSVPGTWMQMTAQAWLVLELTQSPFALAVVTSLQFLPVMLFSLIGGAMADRYPRQKILGLTQALGMLQALVLGLLCITQLVTIWHVYAMALCLGLINALDSPLRQSFISELVPPAYLPNAIAMGSLAHNLGRVIGPALGGVVIAAFGVATVYFINALTFCATISALFMLRQNEFQPRKLANKAPLLRQVGEGLAYARQSPQVMFLFIATIFIGLFGQNFTTIVPLISTYLVNATAAEFGILNSCLGAGSFTAALVMTTRGAPSSWRILAAGMCFGVILIAISFSSSLLLSSIMFFGVGAAAVTFTTSMTTSLQLWSPPEMRGRLVSMINLLIPSPIGPMLTGAAASLLGVAMAVFLNGVICCIGICIAYAYLRHHRAKGEVFEHHALHEVAHDAQKLPVEAPEIKKSA